MGILKNILVGRENGTRSSVRRRIFGGTKSAGASPESMSSASEDDADAAVIVSGGRTLALPKHITPPEGIKVVLHKDALEPGEIAEIIVDGETGFVVPKGDVEQLSQALRRYLTDPQMAVAHGRAGFDRCMSMFTDAHLGPEVQSVVRKLHD